MLTVADIQSSTASIDLTQAGWQRRSVESFQRMTKLPIDIHGMELSILGLQRRRDQAMQELNNQQRQIENATEVLEFLRDKFTATDLYLFLQRETSALYRKMYEMAHRAADEAQRAFNFERGHTTRQFIPEEIWDNLHQGLMAGERLDFALRHMEKAYLDENVREYELTKHFYLAAIPLPDGVFAASRKRAAARSSFRGMDVRPRLSGPVHAPHQERNVDDSLRHRSLQWRALPGQRC